jgi:hypothetical protein
MLKQVVLIFLSPAFLGIAVPSGHSTAAKFTYDQRLIEARLPLQFVGVFRMSPVPPQIFVEAENIERVSQRIG